MRTSTDMPERFEPSRGRNRVPRNHRLGADRRACDTAGRFDRPVGPSPSRPAVGRTASAVRSLADPTRIRPGRQRFHPPPVHPRRSRRIGEPFDLADASGRADERVTDRSHATQDGTRARRSRKQRAGARPSGSSPPLPPEGRAGAAIGPEDRLGRAYPRTTMPARPSSRKECTWNSWTMAGMSGTISASSSRLLMFPVEISSSLAGRACRM